MRKSSHGDADGTVPHNCALYPCAFKCAEAEVAQLREELATANELVSTKTRELNVSMSSPSLAKGAPSDHSQHGGLTVTQVCVYSV